MPTKPKTAAKVAQGYRFKSWDEYVQEAQRDREPFVLPIGPGDEIVVDCPSGDALIRISEAQETGNIAVLVDAIFGDDAPRMRQLFRGAHFPVVAALTDDVMNYYGQPQAGSGESDASSS